MYSTSTSDQLQDVHVPTNIGWIAPMILYCYRTNLDDGRYTC